MERRGYGNGQVEEEFKLEGYEAVKSMVEELGFELPGEEIEEGFSAEASISLMNPQRYGTALLYNDEVTARVELDVEAAEGVYSYEGILREDAYDIFKPPGTEEKIEPDATASKVRREASTD
jgi:hypothetical protein